MPLPKPYPGLVIHYAYLWHDQHRKGLEEGLKDRPCTIVTTRDLASGLQVVFVAPITHAPPASPEDGVELPHSIKRHLGLDDHRSWIVSTEINRFVWPGNDLRPIPDKEGVYEYGVLPPSLHSRLVQGILTSARQRRLKSTSRDEH